MGTDEGFSGFDFSEAQRKGAEENVSCEKDKNKQKEAGIGPKKESGLNGRTVIRKLLAKMF